MNNFKDQIKAIAPKWILWLYREVVIQARYQRIRELLRKNCTLTVETDTVVVLGNGPSIFDLDLVKLLCGRDVIVMNSFYRHPDAAQLNITAYCVGELGPDVEAVDVANVLNVKAKLYWFSTDFKCKLSPLAEGVHLYMPGNDSQLNPDNHSLDLSRPAPHYETTAQMAIMVAMAMGYHKVILLGFDHNFLACGQYLDHFYQEDDQSEGRSNMFINGADYQSLIKTCDRMWSRYKKIEIFARANDIEIVNFGKNSYLDIFRRGHLDYMLESKL